MNWLTNPAGNLDVGRKAVAAAGTAEKLSTSDSRIISVAIQAATANTAGGYVVVGDNTVVAAVATRKGIALAPGDTITLNVDQLSDVWLDATNSGDAVTYLALVP